MSTDEQAAARKTDPLVGQLVGGRYRIHDVIGIGGMGVVYDAVHEELGRAVALKVLSAAWASDEGAIKRFQREARTSSNVGHDNIVDVYDLGRLDDGRPYLAMERLRGESLADLLDEHGRIDAERVARIVRHAASALDAVHAKGLIHRDLKPENLIVVRAEDGGETVKLLDFGLAAFAIPSADNARLTRQGQVHGTPHYMAPESGSDELPDKRADVYALAVVAYEMLCGEVPFDSPNPLHILTQKMQRDAPYMSGRAGVPFPEDVEAVLAKGLAREPEARYQSAGELAGALEHAITSMSSSTVRALADAPLPERAHTSGTATSTSGVVASEPPSMPAHMDEPEPGGVPGQRRLWPWALALALLAVSAVGSWYVLREQEDDSAVASADDGASEAAAGGDDLDLATPPPSEQDDGDEGATAPPDEGATDEADTEASAGATSSETQDATSTDSDQIARRRARRRARANRGKPQATSREQAPEEEGSSSDEAPGSGSSTEDEDEGPDPALAGQSRARAKQLTDKGTTSLVRGRLPDAIRHLRDATNAHPRYAPAWRGLGLANERLGRKPEARRAYQRYLELAPGARDAASIRKRVAKLGG